MFIVSPHLRLRATFQFSKNMCESQIFHTFQNFVNFQMFLLSQNFVLSNTNKNVHIFENIRNIFKTIYFCIWENFQFVLNRSSTATFAILKTLKHFWKFLKISKDYILEYSSTHYKVQCSTNRANNICLSQETNSLLFFQWVNMRRGTNTFKDSQSSLLDNETCSEPNYNAEIWIRSQRAGDRKPVCKSLLDAPS
jgi:hypothetical protein